MARTLNKWESNLTWRTVVDSAIIEVEDLINKTASLQDQIDGLEDITGRVTANTSRIKDNVEALAQIESPGWITSDRILNGTIQAVDISDGAITTDKLANSAVTTDKIAAKNVTLAKVDFVLDDDDLSGGNTKVPTHKNIKNYISSNIATATFDNIRLYTFENLKTAAHGWVANGGYYTAYSPVGFTFPISCSDHNLTKITYHGVSAKSSLDDNQQVMGTVIIDWVARKLKQSSVRSADQFKFDLASWYESSSTEDTGTYFFDNSGEWGSNGKEAISINWDNKYIYSLPCLCSRNSTVSDVDIFKWSFCIEKI